MSLSRTNQYSLFQQDAAKLAAQRLMQFVVYGNQLAAEEMIRLNPELLLIRACVEDYSGRIIEGTAFQAALGAEDINMIMMMIPHLKSLPNGLNELRRQFNQQFPNGVSKPVSHRQGEIVKRDDLYDFTDLVKVINASSSEDIQAALRHEKNQSALCVALENFRLAFTPGTIKQGYHLDIQNLRNAFNIYIHFGFEEGVELMTDEQEVLFWRLVIGYIERLLPACYVQAFAQGLFNLVDGNVDPLRRSFSYQYKNIDNKSFFPLDQDNAARPGYDVALDYLGNPPTPNDTRPCGGCDAGTPTMLLLEAYAIQQRRALWELDCELKKEMNVALLSK